jgi:glycosyltransferase involved in cell wall biosynthesis
VGVVLCNTFPAAGRVGTACRLARTPHAVYIREYIRDTPEHRRVLAKANRVLAVSKDVADYLKDFIAPERIAVAYDHLDTMAIDARVAAHRATGARLLPFDRAHPVVGFVGRITTYKQPDLFLRAIPTVLEQVPHARFVIVGAATEREHGYEEELRRLAKEMGVGNHVAFMGQRRDPIEIMSELAVLCLSSDREPFPRTVLEAQAVGCPVVASNTGGCPEMVEDGCTGLLFPVAHAEASAALASQVVRLLQDPRFGATLAATARKTLRKSIATLKPVHDLETLLLGLTEAN